MVRETDIKKRQMDCVLVKWGRNFVLGTKLALARIGQPINVSYRVHGERMARDVYTEFY